MTSIYLFFSACECLSRVRLMWRHGLYPARFLCPWNFPGKNTGVGSHFLLQEIFPNQELNPDLFQCRRILYQLSYKGSQVWARDRTGPTALQADSLLSDIFAQSNRNISKKTYQTISSDYLQGCVRVRDRCSLLTLYTSVLFNLFSISICHFYNKKYWSIFLKFLNVKILL